MVDKQPAKVMLSILVFVMLSVGFLYAGGTKQKSAVASVNGVLIPKAYLEREIRRFEEQALSQGQMVDESQREELNRRALDTLIDIELLYQESQRRGFEVSEDRIKGEVNGLRDQFADEQGFVEALERIGISADELRTEYLRQLAIQDMIDADISPSTSVSDQESMDFYENNPAFFFSPEQVRARHILIQASSDQEEAEKKAALAQIEEIRARIVAGEDFAELAGQFSEDGSSAYGGDLGFFQREQMVKPFADAAFSLEIGELSDIVTTEYGYHLIQVTDRQEETTVPFEEVQLRIVQYLHREKVMTAIEELAAQLRGQAEIEEYTLPEG
ncbi:MAG: peptidylprolyl isomerase [Spirochaetaceae bacterium]|nr:MAG: peptidylprolyl isomerase [Spirochaetaceae bacterium]